ncbi:hypothetical protein [Mucilaginibacter mallensis]|uniref:hypothetical protein n=1 Tax=Mucilaginibacter mallensis TaxID=652787 RepID=UPI0012FC5F95|nr:hypothetical protein [Mucilaginibacter mallensis]
MEIVYVTTHLVMAICIIGILYSSPMPYETISAPKKLSSTKRFYTHGLKLVEVAATTAYRIAVSVLISYLR